MNRLFIAVGTDAVLLVEAFNTSARGNRSLLSGVERMAFGANINSQFAALGGSGFNNLAASAPDDALFVIGMDAFFHVRNPRFNNLMFFDIISRFAMPRSHGR